MRGCRCAARTRSPGCCRCNPQVMPGETVTKSRVCSPRMMLSSRLRGSTGSHGESRGRLRGREERARAMARSATAWVRQAVARRSAKPAGLGSSARDRKAGADGRGTGHGHKAAAHGPAAHLSSAPSAPERLPRQSPWDVGFTAKGFCCVKPLRREALPLPAHPATPQWQGRHALRHEPRSLRQGHVRAMQKSRFRCAQGSKTNPLSF